MLRLKTPEERAAHIAAQPEAKADQKTYSDKLRDPRWIDRFRVLLRRDKRICSSCGATCTGDVLPMPYFRAYHGQPWWLPDEKLDLVCRRCWGEAEEARKAFLDIPAGDALVMASALRALGSAGVVKALLCNAGVAR